MVYVIVKQWLITGPCLFARGSLISCWADERTLQSVVFVIRLTGGPSTVGLDICPSDLSEESWDV